MARSTLLGTGVAAAAAGLLGLGIGLSSTAGASTTDTAGATGAAQSATQDGTAQDRTEPSREGRCGGDGAGGPRGGHEHTEATADELAQVTDAVTAQDSTLTVESARKDPDGSYDVRATDAEGNPVMVEVSADLATVEVRTGGPEGGRGGHHGRGGDDGAQGERGGHGAPGDSDAMSGQDSTSEQDPAAVAPASSSSDA